MRAGVATTAAALRGLTASLFNMRTLFVGLGAAAGANFAKNMVSAADSMVQLNARIGLVAREGAEASSILNAISAAAERARTPALDLARIFQRSANAIGDMGRSQAEAIRYTETLAKVVKISGTSATEARAAMLQLTQALVSGRLQGDEFRSVTENLPEVLRILQRESGKTGLELRKLAREGQISGEMLFNALLNASKEVDEKFAKVPVTAGEAWSLFTDQLSRTFGTIAANTGVSQAWADVWNKLRETINSPDMISGMEWLARMLKDSAEGFKTLIEWIKEANIQYKAWTQTISESESWKTLKQNIQSIWERAADAPNRWRDRWSKVTTGLESPLKGTIHDDGNGAGGALDLLAGSAARAAEQLREQAKWNTRVTFGAPALETKEGWSKLEVKPGQSVLDDPEKATKRLQRQIELMDLQNQKQVALLSGDEMLARELDKQIDLRRSLTSSMEAAPKHLKDQLELEILLSNELEKQKRIYDENRRFGETFANTLNRGLTDAVANGEKFTDTLRQMAVRLIDLIVQTSILEPIAKNIGKSFGQLMGGNSISNLFGLAPAAGGSLFGFAKGGVFDSPVALAAGGQRGVMAEAGPEAIMPLKRGADGSLGVAMAGGGQRAGDVYITITGDATNETVEKMRRVAREEFTRGSPGLVKASVSAVAREHRADASYLRR